MATNKTVRAMVEELERGSTKSRKSKGTSVKKSLEDLEHGGRGVRISRLEVKNFKALDHLMLDLPAPRLPGEPDVFVLGSRNGLGKTSVLEACALLLVAARMDPGLRKEFLRMVFRGPDRRYDRERHIDLSDLFVRSGSTASKIGADFAAEGKSNRIELTVSRKGSLEMVPENPMHHLFSDKHFPGPWEIEQIIDSLASFSPEPLVMPPLLYFHSFRKVAEGALEFGAWIERGGARGRIRRPGDWSTSAFKVEILSLLMRRADLFEARESGMKESVEAREALDQLNELMERYAGGRIEKLLPAPDSTIDFRIMPSLEVGRSFSFDGLSSGQKEVISTLFLIWRYTREAPGIILIDEPELHLNPEWQRDFVRQIHKITPHSQIIVATHSEDIFGSVPEDRRILLGD